MAPREQPSSTAMMATISLATYQQRCQGCTVCAVAWGDYDQDGDPDIALAGTGSGGPIAMIYRNDNGAFVNLNTALTGLSNSAIAWGDYDNDGDLDLIMSGTTDGTTGQTKLYRNDAGIFVAVATTLPGIHRGSIQWGDYDNDGLLDLLCLEQLMAPQCSRTSITMMVLLRLVP